MSSPGRYSSEGNPTQRKFVPNSLIYFNMKQQEEKNKRRSTLVTTNTRSLYTIPLEDEKRMYATLGVGISGSGDFATWYEWNNTVVATFQGEPTTGTRAYAWESNPANPDVSSPWHNIVYENLIDIYNWGARAFFIYMPFGSFNTTFFLTPEMWKRSYTEASEDSSLSPSRWKGFVQALKAILEGTLAPDGKTPMTEPSNVCIYHSSNRGYYAYRTKSNFLWDTFEGDSNSKDQQYYQYLDSWVDTLISIKSNQQNAGVFSIIMDAVSPSASPSSISHYRTMPDYRSDALELSDWYVFNRLKDAGIDVYYEARGPKSINRANVPTTGTGTIGEYLTSDWYRESFAAEEYWYWFSNPSSSDVNFDNHASDTDCPALIRIIFNNFPIPTNKDPYGVDFTTFTYDGVSKSFTGSFTQYTPQYSVWSVYALSDNYRKYYNIREGTNIFTGIKGNGANLICYNALLYMGGDNCISVYDGQADPRMSYWRLPTTTIQLRNLFNSVSFKANPSSYTGGYWSQQGKDYWDSTVRKNTFAEFTEYLRTYSLTVGPSGSDWVGPFYGSNDDSLYKNTTVV